MAEGTISKAGNVYLTGKSVVRWSSTDGVKPFTVTVDVTAGDAGVLMANKVVDLTVQMAGGKTFTVKDVYPLRVSSGPDPMMRKVVIADCRWLWSYGHLCRRYNWRRHIGHKRSVDPISAPELKDVLPDVYFAKWSIKDGTTPYTALEVLEIVIEEIRKIEVSFAGIGRTVDIDGTIKSLLADYPIDNLQIDESADLALARILGYLPQAGCVIDDDGTLRIYARSSGQEQVAITELGPPVVDEGTAVLVDQMRLRPSKVHVLFTREIEVRFDAIEDSGGYGSDRGEEESRYLENVLSIPDWNLTVRGRKLPQGSWITFTDAFQFWPTVGAGITLSHTLVQRGLVPYFDIWSGFGLLGLFTPMNDWAGRVSAIQQHYRRTYRISREWMDRIFSVRAYRHATIDPETGTRAPATAYSNYCYLGSMRSMMMQAKAGEEEAYATNVQGRPGSSALDDITETWAPAPARVSVVDEDQGIIHLDYQIDPLRMYEMILPAMIEIEGRGGAGGGRPIYGPNGVINLERNADSCIAFDAVNSTRMTQVPKLTGSHAVTVILTVIPGVPNDDRQLHRITKTPGDVEHLVPGGWIPDGHGPPMEVRVGGNFETARIVWKDADRKTIEKAFGLHGDDPEPIDLEPLCVNQGTTAEGASLDSIADAVAARVYAMFQNRIQGTMAGTMNQNVKMTGWMSSVSHELRPGGEGLTIIEIPEQIPSFNLMSLLDSSARAMILKLPQPGK